MRVLVYNNQQYAVGRGGHVFPPQAETEVEVRSEKKLAEIKACVYLKVSPIDAATAGTTTSGGVVSLAGTKGVTTADTVLELNLEEALDQFTKDQLIENFPNVELSMRDKKPEMIQKIIAAAQEAAVEIEGQELDLPPFHEWELGGLQQLAGEWELEAPEDTDHEALVTIVQAEYDRRQQLEASPIETEDDTTPDDETAA